MFQMKIGNRNKKGGEVMEENEEILKYAIPDLMLGKMIIGEEQFWVASGGSIQFFTNTIIKI